MLLDVRTYRCRPGTINAHLALYNEMGKAPQTRHLGQPLAYLKTETGDPNEYVHIW
ncbi:MAG: NIPSNAP family protein, partial [Pseudomonadota bacterium]|nr:NIPSNAP family protein [Pseudomonadota bacterium]MEC8117242.1 NIPSNAP family protein [Pseudomonadota bacterium]